jgi:hypothetical protein
VLIPTEEETMDVTVTFKTTPSRLDLIRRAVTTELEIAESQVGGGGLDPRECREMRVMIEELRAIKAGLEA